MKREVLLEDIRKDRLLKSGDAARLDAAGCSGCSYCCCEMTDTIIPDPWDVYMLVSGLKAQKSDMASAVLSLESLLTKGYADLAVFEGLTLPHLAYHKDKGSIPVFFSTKKEDAAYTDQGRACAGCFRWDVIMKTIHFIIFSSRKNAKSLTGPK